MWNQSAVQRHFKLYCDSYFSRVEDEGAEQSCSREVSVNTQRKVSRGIGKCLDQHQHSTQSAVALPAMKMRTFVFITIII